MNASDLMIGDWVKVYRNEDPVQVVLVNIDSILTSDDPKPVYDLDFEPIPITAEIMKANGFDEYYWNDGKMYTQGFDNEKFMFPFYIEYRADNECLWLNEGLMPMPVRYVHELQHAMRVCGLVDEANTFIIN